VPVPVITAVAKEFRSLSDLPAILYDAPSVKAKKLSILSGLNPLEILARTDRWAKVRDAAGEMGWVETNLLTERRLITVTANIAQIRVAAVGSEPIAFEAERGVVLEMIGSTPDGWLAVRHRDGNAGFVLRSQVFGQ
jgi:SH3-like domain-containing protein